MVRYLSDPWLAEADAALSTMAPLPVPLTVGYVVTAGPDGDRSYVVELGPARVAVRTGTEGADVTLRQTWDTARAVAQGGRSAQRAFLDGDIRIEGDVRALLGHGPSLAAVEDHLAALRARTTF